MSIRLIISAAAITCAYPWQPTCRGELFLTAERVTEAGDTGIETFRITATSDLGNVVGFDFTDVGSYGIFGPLGQINLNGQETIFNNLNSLFGPAADPLLDTQFLVSSNDVLAIHTKESPSYLHGAFSFVGDKQLAIGNSVPFLQIATPTSAEVRLKGAFAIRRPNDEIVEAFIDVRLPDIPRGPAPTVSILPVPVVVPEPVVTPPQTPPTQNQVVLPQPGPSLAAPIDPIPTPSVGESEPLAEPPGPDQLPEGGTVIDLVGDPDLYHENVHHWHHDLMPITLFPAPHTIDVTSIDFSTAVEVALENGIRLAKFVPAGEFQVFTSGIMNDFEVGLPYALRTGRWLEADSQALLAGILAHSADLDRAAAAPEPPGAWLLLSAMAIAGTVWPQRQNRRHFVGR